MPFQGHAFSETQLLQLFVFVSTPAGRELSETEDSPLDFRHGPVRPDQTPPQFVESACRVPINRPDPGVHR